MVPTQKGLTGDVEFISEAYSVVEFGNYDIPEGWGNALAKPTQIGVPAQWENPNTTGFESSSEEETNLYFFHTDHLGSTNYLTDKDGGNSNPSDGDLNILNMIQGQFSNAKFNIYANKKIKPYTKNSKDFEGEMLNEIIIIPRLK